MHILLDPYGHAALQALFPLPLQRLLL